MHLSVVASKLNFHLFFDTDIASPSFSEMEWSRCRIWLVPVLQMASRHAEHAIRLEIEMESVRGSCDGRATAANRLQLFEEVVQVFRTD